MSLVGYPCDMCYAKPGPRCESVARERLAIAQRLHAFNPTDETKKTVDQRRHDFYLTKAGIQELRNLGKDDLADKFSLKREGLIKESKFLQERYRKGKWSEIPLKEMDPGALTMALLDASQDEYIEWGTSSRGDFHRAINAASFWHRDQTRKNRAGFPVTPYIEHPLRGALRAYRWGCNDGETLTAIVLHDTIEDCAPKITGNSDLDPHESREKATEKITEIFGPEVSRIVEGVSNPIPMRKMTKAEKREAYCQHLREVLDDPKVFLTKFTDFADNAGGLHHNYIPGQEGMVTSMHTKYSMAMPIFKESYEKVKDRLPMGSNYQLVVVMGKIENNLARLGERLKEDGISS